LISSALIFYTPLASIEAKKRGNADNWLQYVKNYEEKIINDAIDQINCVLKKTKKVERIDCQYNCSCQSNAGDVLVNSLVKTYLPNYRQAPKVVSKKKLFFPPDTWFSYKKGLFKNDSFAVHVIFRSCNKKVLSVVTKTSDNKRISSREVLFPKTSVLL
jgi:hypothetical protein